MVPSLGFHGGSTLLNRFDNVLVTGATAQIAFELLANFSFAGMGVALAQIDGAHDHARGAKAALQAVMIAEGLLHGMQRAVGSGQPLDGGDRLALGLNGQHGAGLHGAPV